MANSKMFALFLAGLVCVQAIEIMPTATSAESRRRTGVLHRLTQRNHLCPTDGIMPIPGNCEDYFVCTNGHPEMMTCPDGQKFDTFQLCTDDESADCGIIALQQKLAGDLCPLSYGIFGYKDDCRKFVVCREGQAKVRNCPDSQVYTENVGCIEGDVCPVILKTEVITCAEPNGVFPVSTNCTLYLQCIDSHPRIMRCREGKAFDPERSECVDIEETNCDTSSNDVLSIMKF